MKAKGACGTTAREPTLEQAVRVASLGLRVWGLGFGVRVEALGFWVEGLGLGLRKSNYEV